MLNPDLIEVVEETPDTVVTLTNGHRYVVKETAQELQQKIVDYHRSIFNGLLAGVDNN
jgi:flagellar protein FlbD